MSWTLDIIIALIIGLTVYFAYKNGFVKTAISALSFIIAVAVSAAFASPLADFLKQTPLARSIEEATAREIRDMISIDVSTDDILEGTGEEFDLFITAAGYSKEEIKEWCDENLSETANSVSEAVDMLSHKIAEPIISIIATVAAVIILFFGSKLLLAIIAFVLDKVARLPILRSCNKILGIVLGIILALFRVMLFCFIVGILIKNADFLGSDFLEGLNIEKTLLFRLFSSADLFSFYLS